MQTACHIFDGWALKRNEGEDGAVFEFANSDPYRKNDTPAYDTDMNLLIPLVKKIDTAVRFDTQDKLPAYMLLLHTHILNRYQSFDFEGLFTQAASFCQKYIDWKKTMP